LPDKTRIKKQSTINKQGSAEEFDKEHKMIFAEYWKAHQEDFESFYDSFITKGMANELARLEMPVSHYSTFIVTGNLLNWFRFLQLRMAPQAQFEIREYANVIAQAIKEQFPICYSAFEDYWLNSVTFSEIEMEIIKNCLNAPPNQDEDQYPIEKIDYSNLKGRELEEFKNKLQL
jgi:thymidylate synthase (FAD)